MLDRSVSERLIDFAFEWKERGVPEHVTHEAKRLLLNQLKASVGATQTETVRILHESIAPPRPDQKPAHVIWLGTQTTQEDAALVNGALYEVLDFHDTYIPCYMHATSAVLPAVMAAAEGRSKSGKEVIEALALGMEIELAIATILMPTAYFRGYVPAGLTGSVGAAAACSILAGLSKEQMRNAIGIAMCTAFGLYVSVGSMTLSYITGATARSGLAAFSLAERGFDAPQTAFEGDKGMLVTHSDEDAKKIDEVLGTLGQSWRIHGQTYKVIPTETITHGPVELVLDVLPRAKGRDVESLEFAVCPIVKEICDERMARFGDPDSELTARFDLCFCAAAAWQRGRFTLDEMRESAYTDKDILDLRSRTRLVKDETRETFEGCSLTVIFTDGTTETANVDAFLGSPGSRMTDAQLSDLFRMSSADVLPHGRADQILDAVWTLEDADSISNLISLLTLKQTV
ncbi:MAG: MmgE/PrpD family protein [Rhodospirillaceae bacterium]